MITHSPLFTDLYQLTMAYAYWQNGIHERRANFHLSFRSHPFASDYAVTAGLQSVIDFLQDWYFDDAAIHYLATLKTHGGNDLFSEAFLQYLKKLRFSADVYAIPEGRVVFAKTPLLRVEGPLLQCQLLESPLLNIINFQTLIATKASRVCLSAGDDLVVEFGMRRAQGGDGALSASRAAYIGGVHATSHTLAGQLYDIPVRGTHAHSFVTAFDNEKEAFEAYVHALPDHAILLVDTYDTLQGVENAIEIGKALKARGLSLLGIRLDSGDLAKLSQAARKRLDDSGLNDTIIFASNGIDETVIESLKSQGAAITAWGVGTKLATSWDQPALDGVYKLSALEDQHGVWQPKIKISDSPIKLSIPGRHQVRRYYGKDAWLCDTIYDMSLPFSDHALNLDQKSDMLDLTHALNYENLLQTVFKEGELVMESLSIHDIRLRAKREVLQFTSQRSLYQDGYPVSIEKNLYDLWQKLIKMHR